MIKRVVIVLEAETSDEYLLTDEHIKWTLKHKINSDSDLFKIISIDTEPSKKDD